MSVVSLLIWLLIFGLIFGLVIYFLHRMPIIPAEFKLFAEAIVCLLAIILLLAVVFGGINLPTLRL